MTLTPAWMLDEVLLLWNDNDGKPTASRISIGFVSGMRDRYNDE
jgi:hypothetical protein